MNNRQPQIFLSYAWADVAIANEIALDFKCTGIIVRRDVRDAASCGTIADLMGKVSGNDIVILLLSDDFLRSTYCMEDITELLSSERIGPYILPVLANNTNITGDKEQEKYYYHWQELVEQTTRYHAAYGSVPALAEMNRVRHIYDNLGMLFQFLEKYGIVGYNVLKLQSYSSLIAKMDFRQKKILSEIIEISRITDKKGHDNEFIYLWTNNPDNQNVLFYSAYSAQERQEYDIARQRYEALLALFPTSAAGHCHYAYLLKAYFGQYDTPRVHYEKSLELNPYYAEAHHCYAIFLAKQYSLYDEAREHYETAIKLNPQNVEAYNNYALLLAKHFEQYNDARAYLELAIEIDPRYANAHNNLACLLETHYEDYTLAKIHYEEAIRLSRRHDLAKTNLAMLIKNHFS